MKSIVYFLLAVSITTTFASQDPIADFEAIKSRNKRDLSGCIDFRGQSRAQRAYSVEVGESLRTYLKAHITEADRRRSIYGHLMGVATDENHVLLVFYKWSPLSGVANTAWRSEHRARLEELVSQWRDESGERDKDILVRFDDECDVPAGEPKLIAPLYWILRWLQPSSK